ncbi:ATP-binding protein [Streptomyces tubercidicus]|uniref:ATP-binding protein n=1 Tax=Streptomyces tubercidicus TaxID=47759 RepID=UPI002E11C6E8|nr:ATP-binding protein [Streptomyces tubercidicus]WSX23373.1 ATP-binding protein [Streptomyces tubercidicus]
MTGTQQTPVNKAADARDRVHELLNAHRPQVDELSTIDALLVTSELVTNAQRHGGGVAAFSVRIAAGLLELTVADRSPRHPATAIGPEKFGVGGYGWPMIQKLTSCVVIVPTVDGKSITVTVPLRSDLVDG